MAHFKNQVKENSGRTLLEILAVITIIGLVSVLGLTLYAKAMVQIRSNDILQEAEKIFAVRAEKILKHKSFSLGTDTQNKTKYGYDITQPRSKCVNKIMVGVGAISGGRAIDSATCKNLFKSIKVENSPIKAIYKYSDGNGNCKELELSDCSNSETIAALDFEFAEEVKGLAANSYTPPNTPPPAQPSQPSQPKQTPQTTCDPLDLVSTNQEESCMTCDGTTWKENNHDIDICTRCQGGKIVPRYKKCEQCDATNGIKKKYDEKCQDCNASTGDVTNKNPLPQGCTSSPEVCTGGSTFVTEQGEEGSGNFSPTCPKGSYILLENSSARSGCCQACPTGKTTSAENAMKIEGINEPCITPAESHEECKGDTPLKDKNGNCYPCEWPRNLKLTSGMDGTQICIDAGKGLRMEEKGYSVLLCPADSPLRDKDGKCWPCDTHAQIDVEGVESYCNACNGSNETTHHKRGLSEFFRNCTSEKSDCYRQDSSYQSYPRNASGSGHYCNFTCPDNKPLLYNKSNQWFCTSCGVSDQMIDNSYSSASVFDCEKSCDGRDNNLHLKRNIIYNKNLYWGCARACPEDKPLIDDHGVCHSCDETTQISTSLLDDCETVCNGSNTTNHAKRIKNGGYCALACPNDKPLQGSWGDCFPCNENPANERAWYLNSSVATKNCGVCDGSDNTIHKKRRLVNTRYCMQDCPADRPLLGSPTSWTERHDHCYACDNVNRIYLGNDRADECKAVCPDRYMDDKGYCNFSCPKDKPILGLDGTCYACDSTVAGIYIGDSQTAKDSCAKCSNRHFDTYHCRLSCPENKPLEIYNGNKQNLSLTDYCTTCGDSKEKLHLTRKADCTTYCNGSDNDFHKLRRNVDSTYCMACPDNKPVIGGWLGHECHACNESAPFDCPTCETSDAAKICNGSDNTTHALRMSGKGTRDALGVLWRNDESYSCLNRPLRDEQGYCQPCDFNAGIPDKEGETLKACPKKRYINGNYSYSCATADKSKTGLGNNYIQCSQCGGTIGPYIVNGKTEDYCIF